MPRRREPKAGNQCPDRDVSLPVVRGKAMQPASALDLSDDQIGLLFAVCRGKVEIMAAGCGDLFGFAGTAEDAEHLAWAVRLHPEWAERLAAEAKAAEREFLWVYGVPRQLYHAVRCSTTGRAEVIDTRTNAVVPVIPFSERQRL